MLPEKELLEILTVLPLIPLSGPWARVVEFRHLRQTPPEPLWSGNASSRFNPKQAFRRLYLASNVETALKEMGAVFLDRPIRNPPWTLVSVEGILENVLDLTDPAIHQHLATSISELTGDWRYSEDLYLEGKVPMPPTQLLGKAAFESGRILGMRFHSAKNTGQGTNIVVLTDRLTRNQASFLEVYDPSGSLQQRLPASSVAPLWQRDRR